MRVFALGLLLVTAAGLFADEAAWKIDLQERARRRADPAQNAARRAAWIAKGRQAPEPDDNVVEGSYDPTILAPIELVTQVYPVYNLDSERRERFRREWSARGAAELLGKDWWERLHVMFRRAIFIDYEMRRMHALPLEEQRAIAAAKTAEPPKQHSDNGECEAEAEALKAGRAAWGEVFDRFLYQVVAPGVYFSTSSSDPVSLTRAESWIEEWQFKESGCR